MTHVPTTSGAVGEQDPDPHLDVSSDLANMEEEIKKKQRSDEVEKALIEVYVSWSEEKKTATESHRTLQRQEDDLRSLNKIMRSYAYSLEANNPEVINAVHGYIKNAQHVYLNSLMMWLQNNEEESITKPRIQKLLENFHDKIEPRLERYYKKALISPDQRSNKSLSTNASSTSSTSSRSKLGRPMSQASQQKKWLRCSRNMIKRWRT